ncbi:MAG: DUF4097 family beta strand repeat-containing protein [Longimicrobiales bacterium]
MSKIAGAAVIAVVFHTSAVSAQKKEDFRWNHAIEAGKVIEIKGVNGGITAIATNGSEVRVHALKTSKKSNVSDVKIEMRETPRGYTLCALYPTPTRRMRPMPGRPQRPNECTPGEHWNSRTENNDVEVEWTVEVPRGVILSANTVNGDVDIQKLEADVFAHTVNGDVTVTTTGLVRASTVNGSIDAAMGRNTWTGELKFATVNGGVSVTFPAAGLDTQVRAQTVNGDIETDWPLTVRGRFGSKDLNGTIGAGGRMLNLSTVNGSIEIRKR